MGFRIVVGIACMILLSGCHIGNDDIAQLQQIKSDYHLPLFADKDFNYRGSLAVYDVHLYMKPPFFDGDDTLMYEKHVIPSMGSYMSRERIIRHVFDDFFIHFIRERGFTEGAIAASNDGHVVAEAKLEYYITEDSTQGIRVEEFHYRPGLELIYYCQATVDARTMFKQDVLVEYGRKDDEYFFLWPNSF